MFNFFRKDKKESKKELQSLLGDYELPSFPATVMNVLSMLRDPESSIDEVSVQLQSDPGMHVRILRTVNSAAFGFVAKVNNIQHAVSLLGASRLESLVLTVAIKDAMPDIKTRCFDMKQFWDASNRRAGLARLLAERIDPASKAEAFSAGLLQDMAVPFIAGIKKEEYCAVLDRWNSEEGSSLAALERDAFGFDHQSVGALMAEKWEMPEYIIKAISGHHGNGDTVDADPAVRFASYLKDNDTVDDAKFFVKKCAEEFGLEESSVEEIVTKAFNYQQDL